ncbi:hypothetical protein BH10BAC5_BH10BAC5_07470 [soil metagenome]
MDPRVRGNDKIKKVSCVRGNDKKKVSCVRGNDKKNPFFFEHPALIKADKAMPCLYKNVKKKKVILRNLNKFHNCFTNLIPG